jgi:hypothetical protein
MVQYSGPGARLKDCEPLLRKLAFERLRLIVDPHRQATSPVKKNEATL